MLFIGLIEELLSTKNIHYSHLTEMLIWFQVCGIPLTDNVIEIIFHVFDANGDGSLSANEFIRVLQKREKDIAHPTEAGIFSFLSCCWNCSNSYSVF